MTHTLRRARGRAGQTLVVFALLAMILFGVIGLAVDAGVGYLTAATADRAASAAVLAAVVDMPSFGLAQSHAVSVAQSNGIPAARVSVKQDCTLPGGVCYPNRLEVTVTESAPTSFLALFGFGSSTVTKTEEAEYRSPIGLGQTGSTLGADDTNFGLTSGSNPTFYMEQMEGWNVARQQGDAFTPNPQSSYSSGTPGTHLDEHVMNGEKGTDTTPGVSYGGGPSYLARGGYNYLIYVPAGQSAKLQVYNPIFSPDQPSTWTATAGGVEPIKEGLYLDCLGAAPGAVVGAACNSDWTHNPAEYASMRYTIFSTASPYDQTHDSPLSSVVANPIDAWNGPTGPGGTNAWNAGSNGYFNIATGSNCSPCAQPTGYRQWVDVGDPNLGSDPSGLYHTNPGQFTGAPTLTGNAGGSYYRLRVDMMTTDGQDPSVGTNGALQQALKYYALRMVDTSAPNDADGSVTPAQQCAGCQVQAMNDFAFFSEVDGTQSPNPSMQVLDIPADYAGQSVNVDLFDPGDLQVESLPVIPATVASLGVDSTTIHTGQAPEFNLSVLNAGDNSPVCPDPNSKATLSYSTSPGGPFTVLTGGTFASYCNNIWANNSGHFIYGINGPGGSCGNGPDPSKGVWCPGTYYIQATYIGDASYQSSTSNTITLTVDNNNSTCYVDQGDFGPTPVVPGTPIHITGNVLDNSNDSSLTGYINVYDVTNGPPSAGNLMSALGMPYWLHLPNNWSFGFYNIDTSSWSLGPHNIEVLYPPQGNYPSGCSTIFAFSAVSALSTGNTPTVTVNANPGSVTQGNTVTLSANATTGGSPDSNGAFYFSVDGVGSGTAYPDGSGNGSVTISTNGLSASASPGTVHNVSVDYYASGSDTYATTSFNVVISSGGGGGGGGSAYHGGYHVSPLPNWVRGGSSSAQPQYVLMSARKSSPPPCGCYVDISLVQPDNTLATVSAVTVLGPSETGSMGCVDPTVPPNQPDVPLASCPTLPASLPVHSLDSYGRPLYNGQWLQFTVQVPPNYASMCPPTCYWSLKYSVGGPIVTEDALTITTNIASSPVHLLPQPS